MSDRPRGRRAPSVSRGVGGALAPRAHFGRRCCRRGTLSCPAWRRARAARRFRATRHLARLARATSPPPRATTRATPCAPSRWLTRTSAAISPWSSSRRRSRETRAPSRERARRRASLCTSSDPLDSPSRTPSSSAPAWTTGASPSSTRPARRLDPRPRSPPPRVEPTPPRLPQTTRGSSLRSSTHAPSPDPRPRSRRNSVCVKVHDDWDAFYSYWREELGSPGRLVAFSKFGARPHAEEGATNRAIGSLFGAETTGLPDAAHDACAATGGVRRIPIDEAHVRSLNLAVSAASACTRRCGRLTDRPNISSEGRRAGFRWGGRVRGARDGSTESRRGERASVSYTSASILHECEPLRSSDGSQARGRALRQFPNPEKTPQHAVPLFPPVPVPHALVRVVRTAVCPQPVTALAIVGCHT